jgi:alkylated DNA repair dioxygenase AlkB
MGTGSHPAEVTFATASRIQLDDNSWVDHVQGWLAGDTELMEALMEQADWEQRSRWMYNRVVDEPRLTAEYPVIADAPQPVLHYLTEVLAARYQRPYARLWMNWYRDNEDGTGWHADRPQNKLDEAVIPVLSLGATRRFLIKPAGGGTGAWLTAHGWTEADRTALRRKLLAPLPRWPGFPFSRSAATGGT